MTHTAHRDTFARDNLPPRDLWPELLFDLPELAVPGAPELRRRAARPCRRARLGRAHRDRARPTASWTYAQLPAQANRIANVLVETSGSCPATACCCAARTTR